MKGKFPYLLYSGRRNQQPLQQQKPSWACVWKLPFSFMKLCFCLSAFWLVFISSALLHHCLCVSHGCVEAKLGLPHPLQSSPGRLRSWEMCLYSALVLFSTTQEKALKHPCCPPPPPRLPPCLLVSMETLLLPWPLSAR